MVGAPVGTARYWLTLVIVVSRLAADRPMRVKMLALGLWLPLRDRFFGARDSQLRIRFGRLETPWTVGAKSDFDVLNELLVLRAYDPGRPQPAPRVILDLGSHMGASVLFWRERFPDAEIVAVEPDPTTFERLRRNTAALPNVRLVNAAVASEAGPLPFYPAQQGWVSSTRGEGNAAVTVAGVTLEQLISEAGDVDLLKIDIEGAERDIVDSPALEKVRAVVGEYHDTGDPLERQRFFDSLGRCFDLEVDEPSAFTGFFGVRRRDEPS